MSASLRELLMDTDRDLGINVDTGQGVSNGLLLFGMGPDLINGKDGFYSERRSARVCVTGRELAKSIAVALGFSSKE
jgi:hypothetical protein